MSVWTSINVILLIMVTLPAVIIALDLGATLKHTREAYENLCTSFRAMEKQLQLRNDLIADCPRCYRKLKTEIERRAKEPQA